MTNHKLANAVRSVKSVITKHSPEILTGIGITGMITTTVLAVKATPKALRLMEEATDEKGDKLVIPCFIADIQRCIGNKQS